MNIRDRSLLPREIKRNRRRGQYRIEGSVKCSSITKNKGKQLGALINNAVRELGLVGVVELRYDVYKGPRK